MANNPMLMRLREGGSLILTDKATGVQVTASVVTSNFKKVYLVVDGLNTSVEKTATEVVAGSKVYTIAQRLKVAATLDDITKESIKAAYARNQGPIKDVILLADGSEVIVIVRPKKVVKRTKKADKKK